MKLKNILVRVEALAVNLTMVTETKGSMFYADKTLDKSTIAVKH